MCRTLFTRGTEERGHIGKAAYNVVEAKSAPTTQTTNIPFLLMPDSDHTNCLDCLHCKACVARNVIFCSRGNWTDDYGNERTLKYWRKIQGQTVPVVEKARWITIGTLYNSRRCAEYEGMG